MNTDLNNAFFRIIFLSKIIEQDAKYFLPQCKHSGIKNCLKRLTDGIPNNVKSITGYFSDTSKSEIEKSITQEKVAGIHNILSRLVCMNEEDLGKLEDDIISVTKIK